MIESNIEIKLLADCKQHTPYLAQLNYIQLSKIWNPDASIERSTNNLIKHATHSIPLTFVALMNGNPVGMVSLRDNDGIQPERSPWLGGLVVDPMRRQQKIGEKLIDAVKAAAYKLGYKNLYLLAFDPTIPTWYAKLGWKFIGNDQYFNHTVTVMEI